MGLVDFDGPINNRIETLWPLRMLIVRCILQLYAIQARVHQISPE